MRLSIGSASDTPHVIEMQHEAQMFAGCGCAREMWHTTPGRSLFVGLVCSINIFYVRLVGGPTNAFIKLRKTTA